MQLADQPIELTAERERLREHITDLESVVAAQRAEKDELQAAGRPNAPFDVASAPPTLTGERVDVGAASAVRTVPLTAKQRERRGILVGLTVAFVVVLLVQIGFAAVGGHVYERVGPVLSTAGTLIAAGLDWLSTGSF
jgi:hypothetical protein